MNKTKITIETLIHAEGKKVWEYWISPAHITQWNFASEEWHCPKAENDLRVGGKLKSRMEAKDGSFGFGFDFDFEATYSEIIVGKRIAYTMSDGRDAITDFEKIGGLTRINFPEFSSHIETD